LGEIGGFEKKKIGEDKGPLIPNWGKFPIGAQLGKSPNIEPSPHYY